MLGVCVCCGFRGLSRRLECAEVLPIIVCANMLPALGLGCRQNDAQHNTRTAAVGQINDIHILAKKKKARIFAPLLTVMVLRPVVMLSTFRID